MPFDVDREFTPIELVFLQQAQPIRACRVCGCTESDSCLVDGGCSWVEHDLCDVCLSTANMLANYFAIAGGIRASDLSILRRVGEEALELYAMAAAGEESMIVLASDADVLAASGLGGLVL